MAGFVYINNYQKQLLLGFSSRWGEATSFEMNRACGIFHPIASNKLVALTYSDDIVTEGGRLVLLLNSTEVNKAVSSRVGSLLKSIQSCLVVSIG